jgi:hypothetical protein
MGYTWPYSACRIGRLAPMWSCRRRRPPQPGRSGGAWADRHPDAAHLERDDALLELPPQVDRLHALLRPGPPPSLGVPAQPGGVTKTAQVTH